jgi:TetR/AcrR family transcriptional regulator, transcriptional repressor for nem operon
VKSSNSGVHAWQHTRTVEWGLDGWYVKSYVFHFSLAKKGGIWYYQIPTGRFMREAQIQIYKTSLKLFLSKSYKDVTLKEIVENSGLSKGAFYHYFSSKDELFTKILDYYFTNVLTIDFERFDKSTLKGFVGQYVRMTQDNVERYTRELELEDVKQTLNFYMLMISGANKNEAFREKMRSAVEKELTVWTEVVAHARETGEIESSMSNEDIARLFIRSGDGIGIHLFLHGGMQRMIDELRGLWTALYENIRTKHPSI